MVVSVEKCQRCGCNHPKMEFQPLSNPDDDYKFWTLCPTLKEPILLKVIAN